jgi:adenosylcobalamin-dependent ribonucleoside-triphosphate reductase
MPEVTDGLSFKLSDEFIEPYRHRKVDWGYADAAGNTLGEITFLRTYSRVKPDGTKERWHEVCRRVIEGMFSIQKDHVQGNRLPWNDRKAHATAQDAYERMFTFRWTPPGRGLWMMGTALVNVHKNSAALQNCFVSSTRFLTRDGVRRLGDVVGDDVEVWADGDWRKAKVESFGVQPVQRITFAPSGRRSNVRVVEIATPDHRWELADRSLTTDLQVGDEVPAAAAREGLIINMDAFRHGLIFGDGSVSYVYENGDFSHSIRLCGDKAAHAVVFENVHYQPNCNGDPVAYFRSSTNMKQLPTSTDYAYVEEFIRGWIAADGGRSSAGNVIVSTQNAAAAEWLLENAAAGGWVVVGASVDSTTETNFGKRAAPLQKITLARAEKVTWRVRSIELLDEPQEVYCAVVPEVERFTLASGIYTSNCAFVSTSDMNKKDPSGPFAFLMEASMLGIGVGFDTKGADKGLLIHQPGAGLGENDAPDCYDIPDTREGWVRSVQMLLDSYLKPGHNHLEFRYNWIRPAGEPIRTFGGTAAGPEPLQRLHRELRQLLAGRGGQELTSLDILDIANLIGVCVVSGNVRRSAELALGSIDDKDFLAAKHYGEMDSAGDYQAGPAEYRSAWGWMSNNSVAVNVGDDLSPIIDGIARNGEPGVIWLDQSRKYGRLIDPPNDKDYRVSGYNPCAEQSLESYECCTLVETYLGRHEDLEDFKRTLKVAYLYAKTVTLLPTHWSKTNAIMQRNRRIGTSVSGVANFADRRGMTELRTWLNEGYATVQNYDQTYSEWLCVRESIKTTTVKPSGTVSILAGESPGVHWAPGGEYFQRGIVFQKDDPMVTLLKAAGYTVEPSAYTPETSVFVQFPVRSGALRSEGDVSLFEKANLAVLAQRYWSDNSVSVTLSFDPATEGQHVGTVLHMHEGQLKTVSFLPRGNQVYAQMPYQQSDATVHEQASWTLFPVDLNPIYDGNMAAIDAIGESYCSTDACEMRPPSTGAVA